jgi:tetratricopeptide (TPR) repeat protein
MTSLATSGLRAYRLYPRSLIAVILAASMALVGLVPQGAHAKSKSAKRWAEPDEMEARQAFAAGNYKNALDIYTKLYAEKLHPTYLRNIGRCYQNLGDPERAISSFREYLRKAKDLKHDERTEVEGYIAEMEEMQKKSAAAATPPPPPQPVAQPLLQPQPQPQPVYFPQPVQVDVAQQAPQPTPFYKKAWFWGVVGGVVVAGTLGGLWAGGVLDAKSNNGCPQGYTCGGR